MKKSPGNEMLYSILESITPAEQHRTDNRMMMAAHIADVMKEKGISQLDLAKKLGKHHSVITLWLSGTQNFTIDTLSDIETALDTNLLQLHDAQSNFVEFHFTVQQVVSQKLGTRFLNQLSVVDSLASPTYLSRPYSKDCC